MEPIYGLLHPKYVFGLNASCKGSRVHFLDPKRILYSAGNTVIMQRLDSHGQTFLSGVERVVGISAVAVAESKTYAAIGKLPIDGSPESVPTIGIYDLTVNKRLKTLRYGSAMAAREYISLDFTADGRLLASLTGHPDYILILWAWQASRVMGQMRTTGCLGPVYEIRASRAEAHTLCAVGKGTFRFFRHNDEGQLTPFGFQQGESIHFLSQSWFGTEDRLIAGTADGRILMFEKGEYRFDISVPHQILRAAPSLLPLRNPGTEIEERTEISALVAYSKGFAAGHGTGNVIVYAAQDTFEKPEDEFQQVYVLRIPADTLNSDDRLVHSLTICPNLETLIATTANSQILTFPLSHCRIMDAGDMVFDYMSCSFHTGPVTNVSVAIGKSLFATAGADRFIRIWNYVSFRQEVSKEEYEDIIDLSFHPTGHYLLAVLKDKVRIYTVMANGLKEVRDIHLRNCRAAAFSNGGHYLAAGHDLFVKLFEANSYDHTHKFIGHTKYIRQLKWSMDDTHLVSVGMDGAIYEWNVLQVLNSSWCVEPETKWVSVAIHPTNYHIFAVSKKKTIQEMNPETKEILIEVDLLHLEPECLAISRSGELLVGGMEKGIIRTFIQPLKAVKDWFDYKMHSGTVNAIAITFDEKYCISGSADGSVILWKVTDSAGRTSKLNNELVYSENVLIDRSTLDERELDMRELRNRIQEFELEMGYALKRKEVSCSLELKEIEDKFQEEIKQLKNRIAVLTDTIEESKQRFEKEVELLEADRKATVEKLEAFYKARLIAEFEKYNSLQTLIEDTITNYDERAVAVVAQEYVELGGHEEQLELAMGAKTLHWDKTVEEQRLQLLETEETIAQMEEAVDEEIMHLRETYQKRLGQQQSANSQLVVAIRMMKKNYAGMLTELEMEREHMQELRLEGLRHKGQVKKNELAASSLRKDIIDLEGISLAKEKVIFTLKRINLDLEKTKYILDHQIKDLRSVVEPRQREATYLHQQNIDMEGCLENQLAIRSALELRVHEMSKKLRERNEIYEKEKRHRVRTETLVKRIRAKMCLSMGILHDKVALRDTVKEMHKKYGHLPILVEAEPVEHETLCELIRQLRHLELCVDSMKRKTTADKNTSRSEQLTMMQDNGQLVIEIRDLRIELKVIRERLAEYESNLGISTTQTRLAQQAEMRRSVRVAVQNRDDIVFDQNKNLEIKEAIIEAQQKEMEGLSKMGDNQQSITLI